ncbi:hypothetical protein KPB2_5335 [Klebsiella pneumoniae Kb677]|nr:hypothetical protein KPB2_5335 [Klebsiella pneumoniae Kb677]
MQPETDRDSGSAATVIAASDDLPELERSSVDGASTVGVHSNTARPTNSVSVVGGRSSACLSRRERWFSQPEVYVTDKRSCRMTALTSIYSGLLPGCFRPALDRVELRCIRVSCRVRATTVLVGNGLPDKGANRH